MLKIAIFDDEPLICKGLSKKIDWESLGCSVIGTASNGIDGKKLIEDHQPDIILSDIVMPGMTGLELAEYIHQNNYNIEIILLSGFDEFQYAKQALKYGVLDYLLKPTDKKELMRVVKKAVSKIKDERSVKENYRFLESTLQESLSFVEQSMLYEIIVNGIEMAEVAKRGKEHLNLIKGMGRVITVKTNIEVRQRLERLSEQILNLAEKNTIDTRSIHYNQSIIIIPVFLKNISADLIKRRISEFIDEMIISTQSISDLSISIGVGEMFTNMNEIRPSYLQSIQALTESYFVGQGRIHYYRENIYNTPYSPISDYIETLVKSFEKWNNNQINMEVKGIYNELSKTLNKKIVINYTLELLIKVNLTIAKWDQKHKPSIGYEQLETFNTIFELQNFIQSYLIDIKQHLELVKNTNHLGVVEQTIAIIEENYADPNLNVQFIADQLEVNISYLSRSFKEKMDINLIQYLTEKRIEEAKTLLLATDLRTSEISEKVGILDSKYFGQVFKKITGAPPSEFRKTK